MLEIAGAFVAAVALGLGIGLSLGDHVRRTYRDDDLLDVADAMGVTK